jgi:hypothetical protein
MSAGVILASTSRKAPASPVSENIARASETLTAR